MSEPSLSEQLKDAGMERCSLCERWMFAEHITRVRVEDPLWPQPVCPECLMTLENAA